MRPSGAGAMAQGGGMALVRKGAVVLGCADAGMIGCDAGRAYGAAAWNKHVGDANVGSRPGAGLSCWATGTPDVRCPWIVRHGLWACGPAPMAAMQGYTRRDQVKVSSWFHDLTSLTRQPDIPTRPADRNARGVTARWDIVVAWFLLVNFGFRPGMPGLNHILYEAKRPLGCRINRAAEGRSGARCWPAPGRRCRR